MEVIRIAALALITALTAATDTPVNGVEEEAAAPEPGLADYAEAIRGRVNTSGLQDLNNVINLLGSAVDKGLAEEDEQFASLMLSDALMERAKSLAQVMKAQDLVSPDERSRNRAIKIRRLVQSDLRRVIAIKEPPTEAYLLLGQVSALPGGDPHEARRMLKTYVDSDEQTALQKAAALALRARVQSTPEKARADFDRAVELAPENTALRLKRAIYHQGRKDFANALADADAVLQFSPNEPNAYIIKGESLRQLGRDDEAIEAFDNATRLAPRSARPYQNRGELLRDRADYNQAIEQFTKVLELQPGITTTLLQRAETYLRAGRLEEALADANLVIQKQPGLFTELSIAAHRIRGEVLANTDRLGEAIAEIEKVSIAVPDQVELKMQLALYYQFDGRVQNAVQTYSEILQAAPQNFLALRSRGDAYLNLGQHIEAVADFNRALQLNAEDTLLLNNLAWVLSTSPDEEVRDGKRSIELATKACMLTEYKKPHILSTLAAAYAESGDFETAVKWSSQAVEMDDPEHSGQLAEELESYKQGTPWRERQTPQADAEEPLPEADTVPADVQIQPL
ncbi:MAG: tetratricopeptide repeat protein [Planctomycetota bacterium]